MFILFYSTISLKANNIFDFESQFYSFSPFWCGTSAIEGECDGIPSYGAPGVITLISQLPSPLPSTFKIEGTLRFNSSQVWSGLTVKMGDAAQINIDPSISLTLTSGTIIEGCETMWKGVSPGLDATLIVDGNSEINDAVNAIYVTQRCTVELYVSKFKRNYRTLLACSPTLQNISFNLYSAGSIVDGAGPLKPPHSGQAFFEYGPKAESGFRFIRCSTIGGNLKVGEIGSPKCIFRKCDYGISSFSSFILVENCRFEEIAVGGFIVPWFGSTGIYGEYGYYKIQKCEFFHCITGISLYKMNFLVDDNDFTALTTALFARQSVYYVNPAVALPTITNNDVLNTLQGFILFQNDDSNPQINNNTTDNIGKDAISILDIAGLPNRSYIHTNTLSLEGGGWPNGISDGSSVGVRLTTTRNAAVCNNDITNTPDGDENIGIFASGSSIATITNNNLIQSGASYLGAHAGIQYSMTDNSTIDCNIFTNTTNGLRVNGVSTTTKISKNTFVASLKQGMVFNMATTQVQTHTGNRWTYPTDVNFPGAVNNGSSVVANRFFVDAAESADLLPFVQSAPGWFQNESTPGNTPLCNPGTNICSVPPPFAPGGGDGEMIIKIINNELTFTDYADASAWLASRQALSWIAVNGLTTTAPYAAYWSQHYNTSQGKLAQLEADAIAWKSAHTTQEQQMGVLWAEMLALMEGANQSQTAQDLFESKRQQLKTLRNSWDADYTQLLSNWATVNATLSETEIYVYNQKRLNTLLLDMRNRNLMTLTASEQTMLQDVASQCLFAGGPAVLQARYLLSLQGETRWNDAVLCSDRGQESIGKVSELGTLLVMPNPNDGTFQILLPAGIAAEGTQAFLYDMTGRILRQQNLRSNDERFDVSGKIPPGLYLFEVRDAVGGRVGLVKVTIQ